MKTDNFIAIVSVQAVFTTYPKVTPMILVKRVHYIARQAILRGNMAEIELVTVSFGWYPYKE
jgi:hypothetical protein